MTHTILVVEDEEKIGRILQLELEHEGYAVLHANNGRDGLEMGLAGGWDLMLLDIMLPELNGLEVLRRLRQNGCQQPVILLTARDAVPDRVSGLDQGANDYVTKPFAIEELLARIRNLLRMASLQKAAPEAGGGSLAPDDEVHVDSLTMNIRTRQVKREEHQIELTPKEFDLLFYLISHQGEVLSREKILSEVWGYDFIGDTNVVDVYIRYLRQKVDQGYSCKLIHTLRGVGYLVKNGEPSS
ncbi:response regulator transcription factor [Paenibacillus doosanensis]|uniref:response regulator transcription factor n=1 Tax=Paenibacillus doosanensis TaxID=1229154 RepID=UPI00217FF856|nr:response regulator transcription factor [Paenibacillus doosanensis]MCS7461271.1 response regulator transcription factor [Paenibacillus doosanensis]